jgi:two-component system sensor histidine kinase KdpD
MSHPPLSAEQASLAASLSEKSLRMADMVTKLLDMARMQSGGIRLRAEWQSLEEIIGSAVKSAHGALGARRVTVQIDPDVPFVECDAVLIERVLANLLENAGKYTPSSSPVEIRVRPVSGALHISVHDHGPGVPKGQEEAIFEKFTRGHVESATPGMGLGLAICRAIVEAHGGRIWSESARGAGSTFTFTLPMGTPPSIDAADLIASEVTADEAPAVDRALQA